MGEDDWGLYIICMEFMPRMVALWGKVVLQDIASGSSVKFKVKTVHSPGSVVTKGGS